MWLALVASLVFAQEPPPERLLLPNAELVLAGKVTSAIPGERAKLWDLARSLDFKLLIPEANLPVVCLKVTEALYGDFMGDKHCFYRVSGLSIATENLTAPAIRSLGAREFGCSRSPVTGTSVTPPSAKPFNRRVYATPSQNASTIPTAGLR